MAMGGWAMKVTKDEVQELIDKLQYDLRNLSESLAKDSVRLRGESVEICKVAGELAGHVGAYASQREEDRWLSSERIRRFGQ